MSNQTPFSVHKYLLMTLDPVHVGTGGYRLGRVELSIVREPGTRLPKIPGTSLSGAIRSYAAYRYGKRTCAGQKGHCGQPTCPICYTFGSVTDRGSFSGVVSIGDARILLFPVYSMAGPVWVTSPSVLRDFCAANESVGRDKAKWGNEITTLSHLNLGWLMVERDGEPWTPPQKLTNSLPEDSPIRSRIVLVSDEIFSVVVNSNLEVRTSVSINPETGAAEEGALFTYEAIPRSTVLWMEVVVDDFRERFPQTTKKDDAINHQDNEGGRLDKDWRSPTDVVVAGLEWAEHLGIGGMGTRGFGRIRNLGEVSG